MNQNIYPSDYPTEQGTGATIPDLPAPAIPDVAARPKTDWGRIGLIGGGILVLLALVIGGLIALLGHSAQNGAQINVNAYCQAIQKQDYTKAYTHFTADLQKQVPQDAYTDASQGYDTRHGNVTACTTKSVSVAKDGKSAVAHTEVTRRDKEQIDLALVPVGSDWKINKAPDISLYPLAASFEFCKDVSLQQYQAAYNYLTPNYQKTVGTPSMLGELLGSLQQYAGPFGGCTLQGFILNSDKGSGIVSGGIDFQNMRAIPSSITVLQQGDGAWAIDGISIQVAGQDVPLPVNIPISLPTQ